MTPTEALATALESLDTYLADDAYYRLHAEAILAALPDGARLFTVESLAEGLERHGYTNEFANEVAGAIIQAAKETERE